MKRLIAIIATGILALMLLLPNASSAVETKGGIKIGVNSARLSGDDVEDWVGEGIQSRMGFCVGGFITFNITEVFAIQPEVLYTMKGAKYTEADFKIVAQLTYLELPVLAKFSIPTQGNIKPIIFAGPAVALKLSGKWKETWDGETETYDLDEMKGMDFGLVFGAGVDFGLGESVKGKLTVDLRYTLGLTNFAEIDEEDVKAKNGVFSLMVGFSF